jgi:hypothetical protein
MGRQLRQQHLTPPEAPQPQAATLTSGGSHGAGEGGTSRRDGDGCFGACVGRMGAADGKAERSLGGGANDDDDDDDDDDDVESLAEDYYHAALRAVAQE